MLNSLVIKNFRMLEDFTVSKLGRVNLIVGKNNSGKSTVLEALRIYAGNANQYLLEEIAESHDEKSSLSIEDIGYNNISFPFEDFFSGRQFPKNSDTDIIIGESISSEKNLFIRYILNKRNNINIIPRELNDLIAFDLVPPFESHEFLILKENITFVIRLEDYNSNSYFKNLSDTPIDFKAAFIPTQFIAIDELEKEWKKIELIDDYENIIAKALQIIVPDFKRFAFDGEKPNRWIKVKLANLPKPVPLKSLGDGMLRILQIAIKLVSAQGGFLLIDEFENGLHYSVQEKIWRLLFEMAKELDIQVFATTHSWDCIESFTKVAIENETTEGVLFRMGRSAKASNKGQVIATVYDKAALYDLTQIDMEIR